MPEKPATTDGYSLNQLESVRATCLYVATKLGDLMDDLVVVGGLVPSLLIDQEHLPVGASPHAGTMDLDLGLAFALIGEERYQAITDRLRRAGFGPDSNKQGRTTRQRWRISNLPVTVDFLIEPKDAEKRAGKLMNIEDDFAAMIVPGLHMAFADQQKVTLHGATIFGEVASREVLVCGPGAFVVLKALAFNRRGENKDAYDLFYVLRNYGSGVGDVAARLAPLLSDRLARTALEYLRNDFLDPNGLGPRRVAEFQLGVGRSDAATQADVVGFVRRLLEQCKK